MLKGLKFYGLIVKWLDGLEQSRAINRVLKDLQQSKRRGETGSYQVPDRFRTRPAIHRTPSEGYEYPVGDV